jgi:CHASE2 domain-containing sensor protein
VRRQRVRAILASPPTTALVVVLLLIGLAPILSFVELRFLDLLFALTPSTGLDPRIAVIDIGEDAKAYDRERPDLRVCPEPPEGCEVQPPVPDRGPEAGRRVP